MSDIQTFKTPAGEEMVILSRAEYDALVDAAAEAAEDAEDAALYLERKAEMAAGTVTLLPAEVSALVHRGDSVLKAARKWRGLSQVDLASAIGIGQAYLSALETGQRNMTAELAGRLAQKLDVPVSWLI